MKKIKINEVEYLLPENWNDVNIQQYKKIQDLIFDNPSLSTQITNIISIFLNIDIEDVRSFSLEDVKNIDISFINNEIKKELKKVITIDNKKYGLVKDLKKLTLGEYVDLDYYITIDSNLENICAIIMRPVIDEDGELYTIEKYDSETSKDRAILFGNKMNIEQMLGVYDFFIDGAAGYLESLKNCL
jgi:hypothetical protein